MDDDDFETWMELTLDEQEEICRREERRYNKWFSGLPFAEQFARHRRSAVQSCLMWRGPVSMLCPALSRESLREAQIRLLKLRTWRATGTYPGTA